MPKEQFAHRETSELLQTLDEVAQPSGVSRGQAFEDFLHMSVCALSGGTLEEQYLEVVAKHTAGKPNLALRNRYGHVIWGDSLRGEQRLVYRTGFNGRGFLREVRLAACPPPVQAAAATMVDTCPVASGEQESVIDPGRPATQLWFF